MSGDFATEASSEQRQVTIGSIVSAGHCVHGRGAGQRQRVESSEVIAIGDCVSRSLAIDGQTHHALGGERFEVRKQARSIARFAVDRHRDRTDFAVTAVVHQVARNGAVAGEVDVDLVDGDAVANRGGDDFEVCHRG